MSGFREDVRVTDQGRRRTGPCPEETCNERHRPRHPEPAETLEATVSRSLEKAFRQFGRELAG